MQQKRIYLPVIGMALFCVLAGLSLAAWKRLSKSASAPKVVKHKAETSPEEALDYWSADKMRRAKPAPMPVASALERVKRRVRRSSSSSRPSEE